MKRYWICCIWLSVFIYHGYTYSQHLIEANVADLNDAKSPMINPALSTLYNPLILVGAKVFHGGFLSSNALGLRNNYINITFPVTPYLNTGIGFSAYHLATPIYTRTSFGLSMSKGFFNKIYIGGKVESLSRGFNESEFNLIHEDDPVFRNGVSKNTMSLGGGLLIRPFKLLTIASSIHHMNRPKMTLGEENIREKILTDFGISFRYSYYRLSAGLTGIGSDYFPNVYFNTDYWNFVTFCLGYEYSGLRFGCRFNITRRLELNYDLNFPISEVARESYGSHQINLVYYFDKSLDPPNIFDIMIGIDTLFVFEQWYHQELEPGLYAIVAGEKLRDKIPQYYPRVLPETIQSDFIAKYYSNEYLSFLDSLSERLKDAEPRTVRIVTEEDTERALGIKRQLSKDDADVGERVSVVAARAIKDTVATLSELFLVKDEEIAGKRHQLYVSSPKTNIHISSTDKMRTGVWRLQIIGNGGEIARQFEGSGKVPSRLEWNWCDHEGKLIDPGWYSIIFRWRDLDGKRHDSAKIEIRVTKRVQHMHVEVSKAIKGLDKNPDAIDIILKK